MSLAFTSETWFSQLEMLCRLKSLENNDAKWRDGLFVLGLRYRDGRDGWIIILCLLSRAAVDN